MPRDGRQVIRFTQQAFAAANQFQTNNYAMSASTSSTGALIGVPAASSPTASLWYRGTSVAFNRAGFRDVQADASVWTSAETSAILNDPATFGNTEMFEGYVRMQYCAVGNLNTSGVTYEVFVEAASDSGTGTAGTDWTAISASLPLSPIASYTAKTPTSVSAGVVSLSAHGLQNGAVVFFGNTGDTVTVTNFAKFQPLFVVNAQTNSFGLTTVRGSSATDTTLSAGGTLTSSLQYSNNPQTSGGSRIISIPVVPSAKPWVRVVFRAIPASGTTLNAAQGLWLDSVGFTVGRDTAAVI